VVAVAEVPVPVVAEPVGNVELQRRVLNIIIDWRQLRLRNLNNQRRQDGPSCSEPIDQLVSRRQRCCTRNTLYFSIRGDRRICIHVIRHHGTGTETNCLTLTIPALTRSSQDGISSYLLSLMHAQLKYRLETNWTSALDFLLHLHWSVLFSERSAWQYKLQPRHHHSISFAFESTQQRSLFVLLPLLKPTKPSIPPKSLLPNLRIRFRLDLLWSGTRHLVRALERNWGKTLTQEVSHKRFTYTQIKLKLCKRCFSEYFWLKGQLHWGRTYSAYRFF